MEDSQKPSQVPYTPLVPPDVPPHHPEEFSGVQYNYSMPLFTAGDDRPRSIYMEPINWPPGIDTPTILEPIKTKVGGITNGKQLNDQGRQTPPSPPQSSKEPAKRLEERYFEQASEFPQQPPPFKEVSYYNEGSKRTCFVNFNNGPLGHTSVAATDTKDTTNKLEAYKESGSPRPPTMMEPTVAKTRFQKSISEPGLLAEPAFTNSKAKISSTLPKLSMRPTFNKPKSHDGNYLDEEFRSVQLCESEDQETQSDTTIDEGDTEKEGEEGWSSKQDYISQTAGKRIRYTDEQESWLLRYITENTAQGDRKDWIACRLAFLKRYKQDRKPFSLCQKWKELNGYLVLVDLHKDLDNGFVEGRREGEAESKEFRGSNGKKENGKDEEKLKVGAIKLEELKKKVKGKKGGDEDGHRGNSVDEENGILQGPPLERSHKHYSKEEKDWLISYVDEIRGLRIDWGEVAHAYTRRFRFVRTERMLYHKWKEMREKAKKLEKPPPAKKARLIS